MSQAIQHEEQRRRSQSDQKHNIMFYMPYYVKQLTSNIMNWLWYSRMGNNLKTEEKWKFQPY